MEADSAEVDENFVLKFDAVEGGMHLGSAPWEALKKSLAGAILGRNRFAF